MTPSQRIAACAAVAALALLPLGVQDSYILHLLIMIGIYVVLASALDLVLGHLNLLSLAHIAFFGIGGYASALVHLDMGWSFWLAAPFAALVTAVLGTLIGAVTLRLRGPYFVIVTLGFAQIIFVISLNWIDLTRGPMGLAGIAPPAVPFRPDLPFSSKAHFYYLVFVFALAVLLLKHRLVSSYIGRAWNSIREDENLAESVGVSGMRYSLLAFVLGAALSGVAGSVYTHYIQFLSPEVFEFGNIVTVLVMVIIGGRASLMGPVLGAVIFTVLLEYLRVAGGLRLPILGAMLILGTIFFPQGLVRVLAPWRGRRRAAAGAAPAGERA